MSNKVSQYLKAEFNHALNGAVTDVDAKKRLDVCMTCEHRAVEYKGMVDPAGFGYCAGGCGCGANGRAQLQTKVTIAGAVCPKGKWENIAQTVGGSIQSATEAIGGVFSTAKSFIFNKKEQKQKPIDMDEIRKMSAKTMNEIAARFNLQPIDPSKIQITFGTKDSPNGEEKVG